MYSTAYQEHSAFLIFSHSEMEGHDWPGYSHVCGGRVSAHTMAMPSVSFGWICLC